LFRSKAFAEATVLEYTEVAISPLSGDEKVRRRNGKFYTNDRFLGMLRALKEFNIPIFIYFSLNLPGETPETFQKTLKLAAQINRVYPPELLRMLNPCHTLDPVSPMLIRPDIFDLDVHYKTFKDYYNYCKGTGWEPRHVIRGQHRGFEMVNRPVQVVEQMAQQWDTFAAQQPGRCYPVPRGW
ncbi:MAG: radical SAM protein, partial [Chloroflexota bacterium]